MKIKVAMFLLKLLFFIFVFLMLARHVHLFPASLSAGESRDFYELSQKLGIRDPNDLLYLCTFILNCIMSAFCYLFCLKVVSWLIIKYRS